MDLKPAAAAKDHIAASKLRNSDIAALLNDTADLLEIKGGNPFRIRAYRNAARILEGIPRPVEEIVLRGEKLEDIRGIGKDLANKILTIARLGSFPLKTEIEKELPTGILALLKVPSLGPKKVAKLYKQLKIHSIDDLRNATDKHLIQSIPGFGAKSEERIRREIEILQKTTANRMRLSDAEPIAAEFVNYINFIKGVGQVTVAGSFRRRKETVGDLDIIVTFTKGCAGSKTTTAIFRDILKFEAISQIVSEGPTRATIKLYNGLQIDIRIVPTGSYGAALYYFTGSKAHNIAIRSIAQKRGLKINEYGVFKKNKRIAGRTEDEIFNCLNLSYIEPELRENQGEIEAAAQGLLPKLIELTDIRGDLHFHTVASDGLNTLEEMAIAARKLGYEYVANSEHTKSLTIAHGLDERRFRRHLELIDELNDTRLGIKILKSAEVDILKNGDLDLATSILKELDVVLCAVHSSFQLTREKQTERLLRAIDNPYTNILAHPLTRLIDERPAIDFDTDRVLDAVKKRGCILEINAQPSRLDLTDIYARLAAERGIKFAISTDSHHTSQLQFMRYGIDVARRAWLQKADVINTLPLQQFLKSLATSRNAPI